MSKMSCMSGSGRSLPIRGCISVLIAVMLLAGLTACSTEDLNELTNAFLDAAQEAGQQSADSAAGGADTISSPADNISGGYGEDSIAGNLATARTDRYQLIPDEAVTDELDLVINRAIAVVNAHDDDPAVAVYDYEPEPLRRDSLDEYSAYAYDVMYGAASTFTPCTISESDLGSNPFGAFASAQDALRADHPELLLCFDMDTLSREYKSIFFEANMGYDHPSDDMDAVRAGYDRYLEVFDRIINRMPEGMSNYEKCMYLSSVIAALTTYDHDKTAIYDPFQAYNALVAGGSICQGYSQAFMLLAHAAGVNCKQMETERGDHVWDVLNTSAGTRYIDVTWMDGDCEQYNTDFSGTYFLMDDEDLEVYGYR